METAASTLNRTKLSSTQRPATSGYLKDLKDANSDLFMSVRYDPLTLKPSFYNVESVT